jgi:predicted deacetylase
VRRLAAVRQVAGDVPVTILAVPRYHDEARAAQFELARRALRSRGDELALHGCTHRDDGKPEGAIDAVRRSHYTRGEGEFWSLSRREALARIDVGIAWFAKHRWPLSGFVARRGCSDRERARR